ncbi:MAG: hypothetical protein Kow0084_06430 [Pseudothermotoga elfii]
MMKRQIIFFMTLITVSYLANPIFDFVQSIAGCRDFYAQFQILARVKSGEDYQNLSMSAEAAIRNLEDFYLLIKEPVVLSDLSFVYIARTKRLYSSFPGYIDMENIEIPVENILTIFESIFKILQTPLVITKFDDNSITISPTSFVLNQASEPVIFKLKIEEGNLKEFTMTTSKSNDEYIKIQINKLILFANIDQYFHLAR